MGWIRCRVLAFLDTAYYDNVLKEKEKYANPSIELVAEINGQIIGLLDIEYEKEEGTVCSRGKGKGGMIWHIAVHPDYRRAGVGQKLLQKAEEISKELGLNRLEAWTRDDMWVNKWYKKNGFEEVDSYLHVFIKGKELEFALTSNIPNLYPIQGFFHYVGDDKQMIAQQFQRVHECFCFIKKLH
ncbi:GNAT family acetyltransferase [Alkalihalobacillus pseudalcaliphilus]|nr:GNAT family acetyltransferase [Alkalihalobacillus pseudalcaliphilus]